MRKRPLEAATRAGVVRSQSAFSLPLSLCPHLLCDEVVALILQTNYYEFWSPVVLAAANYPQIMYLELRLSLTSHLGSVT